MAEASFCIRPTEARARRRRDLLSWEFPKAGKGKFAFGEGSVDYLEVRGTRQEKKEKKEGPLRSPGGSEEGLSILPLMSGEMDSAVSDHNRLLEDSCLITTVIIS